MTRRIWIGSSALLLSTGVFANSIQIFGDLNFDNPAYYGTIKHREFVLGDSFIAPNIRFRGTSAGMPGSALSTEPFNIPYARAAFRIAKPVVIGVDISTPWATDVRYPANAITRFASTLTYADSVDISPTIAVNFSPSFAVGAGLDFQYFNAILRSTTPTPFGDLTMQGSSWAYPFRVGAIYIYEKRAIFGLAFHSPVTQDTFGYATLGPLTTRDNARFNLPGVITADAKAAITESVKVFGQARYSLWDTLRTVNVNNTPVGRVPLPFNYHNSWFLEGGVQYNPIPKLALRGALAWDESPANSRDNTVSLPIANLWTVGAGAEYNFTNEFSLGARYAYTYGFTRINNANFAGVRSIGNDTINANTFSLRMNYRI